jgi:hypothetical protein
MEARHKRRCDHWARIISAFLNWPKCSGLAYEYIVCDMRERGGNLEMVHIMGHSARDIRKQVAKIIMERQ